MLPYTEALARSTDPLAPLRLAVWKADQAHRAAQTIGALNLARANYTEAVDALRNAEYHENPAACDHHHLAA